MRITATFWRDLLFVTAAVLGVRMASMVIDAYRAPDPEMDDFERAETVGSRGDTGWYLAIAEHGYPVITDRDAIGHARKDDVVQTQWAFFPLYPWLIRATMLGLGITASAAMALWSLVLGIAALLLFHRFARERIGDSSARWVTAGLLLFPTGIYFHVHYTEALFFVLLMGAFLAAHHQRAMMVAACAALLALVRPNGLFMLLPIAVYWLERTGVPFSAALRDRRKVFSLLIMLLPAVLVFIGYCTFQWSRTGTPFAFSYAQAGWDRHLTFPFMAFFRSGDVGTQVESWYTIVLILFTIPLWKRLPLSFNLLLWLNILLPLCSGSVDSMTRFTIVLFPYFLLLGKWLEQFRFRWIVLTVSFLVQLGWWLLWLAGEPIAL
ncbi:MAG: hypothetical protein WAU70_06740 [Flavobacteriales bacterium]